MLTLENPAFKIYALCSGILGLQLVLLGVWTGTVRVFRKQWVNPEDIKIFPGTNVDLDHPDVLRTKRAHINALENAVPFFVLGLLYVSIGASARAASIYFITFTAARVVHSIAYLWGRQPFRTLAYSVGAAALGGLALQIIIKTL